MFSELLDQLQTELLKCPSELVIKISSPFKDVVPARELLQSLFEGQLMSTVRRSHIVNYNPFSDYLSVSLLLPSLYFSINPSFF